MNQTQIEQQKIIELSARIKMLPFLHLGFAFVNLLYLWLHGYLWDFCKKTIHNPNINKILLDVYGIQFLDYLYLFEGMIQLSGFMFLVTAILNFYTAWVLYKSFNAKILKLLAWINIGIPPFGTILGIMCLYILKNPYLKATLMVEQNRQKP